MSALLIALVASLPLSLADPPPGENPLAGPTVAPAATAPAKTLVTRGFEGQIEILSVEPEVAAVELLDLTNEQRERFGQLKAERNAVFSRAIRENLDLLMEFGGVDPQERPGEFLSLMKRIGIALSEYRARGTMLHEMTPILTREQMREARRLVAEYVQARAEAIRREQGEDTPAMVIAVQMQFETLGAMARSTIESAVAMGAAEFEAISMRLQLTPEQKLKIQKIYEPIAIQELQGKKVNPFLQVRAFYQISHLLSKEQMARFAEYTREEKQAAAAMDAQHEQPAPKMSPAAMQPQADR